MSPDSQPAIGRYSETDDATLLHHHVQGDHEAFGELFRRHQDRIWAVALRTLGDPDEAADAVQDAMINAFRRAEQFSGRSAVTTWLHRIVVNACLDRVRRSASRPADPTPFDEHSGSDDDSGAAGLVVESGAPDVGDHTALRLDLESALATLPADQRVPLVLVDVEGYGVADVAEMLGIPAGTVKSRCARGRSRLIPLLSDGNQNGSDSVPSETGHGRAGDGKRR